VHDAWLTWHKEQGREPSEKASGELYDLLDERAIAFVQGAEIPNIFRLDDPQRITELAKEQNDQRKVKTLRTRKGRYTWDRRAKRWLCDTGIV
jgi:hypothetical protein